jgi:DNA repair protein RadD
MIKADLPVVEVFKVDHITFSMHTTSKDGIECVKVSYYCKSKRFDEFVLFNHKDQWSQKKVRAWWTNRSALPIPPDTKTALELCESQLKPSTHLRVWTNKKYPEIMAHCFDGSAFGAEEPKEFNGSMDTRKPEKREARTFDLDDEIPF